MVPAKRLTGGFLAAGLTCLLAGCMNSGFTKSGIRLPAPTPRTLATPTLSHQVRLAQHSGPGFLDFCPVRPGTAPASYDLIAPHGGVLPGSCSTAVLRGRDADYVTFRAYWDARAFHRGQGTNILVYFVSRRQSLLATPTPLLIRQSGPLPP